MSKISFEKFKLLENNRLGWSTSLLNNQTSSSFYVHDFVEIPKPENKHRSWGKEDEKKREETDQLW